MPTSPLFDLRAPILRTRRCILGLPKPTAADAVLDYYERNRLHLEPWEPDRPAAFYSTEFWHLHLRHNLEDHENGLSLRMIAVAQDAPDRMIGSVNLANIVRGVFLSCHLGYSLDGGLVGHGLAGEAVGRLVEYAFEGLGLHRVQAAYIPENQRSARLLERLGFEKEGLAREYLFIAGAWRDHVLTARRNKEIVRPPGS